MTRPDRLAHQLATSATRHAHLAMKLRTEDDVAGFYLHAGTALEHAIKARLCRHHPAYLAPAAPTWFATAARLARDTAVATDEDVKTVGAHEALIRLQILEPNLSNVFGANVRSVLELRNHVAHIGMAGPLSDEQHLARSAAFVRAVNALLQQPPAKFWGPTFADLASSLERDDADRLKVTVSTRIAAAILRFEAFSSPNLRAVYEETERWVESLLDPGTVAVKCPVCASSAIAHGTLVDEGDAEVDEEGEPHWVPALYCVIDVFECRTCGLTFFDDAEIAAAGLPPAIPNPNADPSDVDYGIDPDF